MQAFEYKKLLMDYNREVRRATHDTMTNLVLAVGRDLALHLKSLMGPWWFSQFDQIPEVAQGAKHSLQAAFPAPEKRLDALILCTTEIFMYLDENLKLTPQSMSDKVTALDELEEMHQQVISSSLLALATLIDILVGSQLEKPGFESITAEPKHASKARATAISFAEKLFSSHRYFLDFVKSQSPAIRSATYSMLRSCIKNIPHAFNEENMKTLASTILGSFQEKDPSCHSSMWDAMLLFSKRFPDSWRSVNVQKILLNRFWHFLRNGCFGSQQISYPSLVLFLDSLPPKEIEGEKFFLEFFQNLWVGRNPSNPSNADRVAFFQAFKECFLWGLHNASRWDPNYISFFDTRYCNGVDAIHHFRVTLIDSVLVKLFWHEYMSFSSSKNQDVVLWGNSKDPSESSTQLVHKRAMEKQNIKYPKSYAQDLGKCIIEILSGIYLLDHDLLSAFCSTFQENCLEIVKQTENREKSENVEQIVKFLLLVEQYAVLKDETWPLIHLVGPMLSKSFPLIRSLCDTHTQQAYGYIPYCMPAYFLVTGCGRKINPFGFFNHRKSNKEMALYSLRTFELQKCHIEAQGVTSFGVRIGQSLINQFSNSDFQNSYCSLLNQKCNVCKASPDAVRLFSVAVSVFGPRKIIQELICNKALSFGHLSHDGGEKLGQEDFLQVFKELFTPWCLLGHDSSISAQLDLLLALFEDESFAEQWCIVITYATKLECCGAKPGSLDSNQIAVLAILMEKAREKLKKRKVGVDFNHHQGCQPDHWHHELLDLAAVSVACSLPPYGTSDSRFIRAVLGGSVEDDQASFLSRDAMILIFEDVLKTPTAVDSMTELESSVNMLEATQFALEILDGSFFCLQTFCEGSEVVPCLSAALFIIGWECNMARALDNAFDDQSMEITKARMNFGEALLSLRGKINKTFWQSLSIPNQKKLGSILILTIRSAIFKEDKVNANEITSLCFLWMAEVLECLCQDQYQEQNFLDLFLANSDVWPLWIMPDSGCAKRSASLKLKKFLLRLIWVRVKETGWLRRYAQRLDRVVAGYVSNTPNSTEEASKELATSHFYSRAWLAAEILCTWKWQGGSALGSFLPLLCSYAKSGNCSLKEGLLDSIVNILLDGALVYGASGELRFFNVWSASDDEVESIEEPFLRALVSFLITLFTENIWGKDQAVILFGLLANKLFIGESVNAECLRIFPLILSVLIRPLYTIESDELHRDAVPTSFEENQICDTIKDWVQRTLSFPPLTAWETGQDMEEWLQLVLSCYPLRALGGSKALNLERDIDPVERSLLLDLFRKQRHAGKSAAASQLPMVQILLSKLMAVSVGYCWKEFNEEDWEFVLFHLRRWIESAVVMMEEVAENVNDVIINRPSSDDKEVILKELEHAVLLLDSPRINIARNALFAFSLFSGLTELQNAEDADNSNPLRRERWDLVKDRIVEGILRLFFSTGVTEAIASSYTEASSVIASTRLDHPHFWELIALSIVNSSLHARDRAVRSIELWGLSKGPISSLYAILFSSKPVPSLQFAAYFILATEPVSNSAIISKGTRYLVGNTTDTCDIDSSSEEGIQLREDISCIIERLPYEILEVDLVAQQRVYVFLAWSLLLSHLLSSPPSSPTRERLIQHIQESANSTILDCIFQHIPLELSSAYSLKKKDIEIPAELSEAATAATRAISTGSLLFYVESLWPVGPVKMASLAGALFGLMLRVLPAYVRQWFSDLRDRSASSLIEYFTKAWCSPPLIADELSQIKKASFADENFSVSVSKSANEVVATYTKDETGMDLVIRLPPSYPLRSVDVDCTRSLGISEVKQRKWLMSMTSFVRNQNGALAEAIRIWKNNFDKEFEGVEECPICYSVIHTVNHSLPRLACKTCKHKFHSACLYKWFSTSHKSTCPLCQSPF
ncbi:E3 ubiquitin-protein ligase listerin [Vitis vinifera]|uniref:E3 ubiquitin-protein ligase listerin n=1 Tax=Vitis vinifera TaxID=29760 RepID=A0A438KND6_VITVI|nr:E3 ubiquitin-protein ligase listerin [Vitis vinifera]